MQVKNRLQCAWNCLRGRPTCYRMTIGPPSVGMIVVPEDAPRTLVYESTIRGDGFATGIHWEGQP